MAIIFDTKGLIVSEERFGEFLRNYARLQVREKMPVRHELDEIQQYLQKTFDNIASEVGVNRRIRPVVRLVAGGSSIDLSIYWSVVEEGGV